MTAFEDMVRTTQSVIKNELHLRDVNNEQFMKYMEKLPMESAFISRYLMQVSNSMIALLSLNLQMAMDIHYQKKDVNIVGKQIISEIQEMRKQLGQSLGQIDDKLSGIAMR